MYAYHAAPWSSPSNSRDRTSHHQRTKQHGKVDSWTVRLGRPEPPVCPELPEQPVCPERPEPPVCPELPEPPVSQELPEPHVSQELPEPPFTPELLEPPFTPVLPESPFTPALPESPACPVLPESPVHSGPALGVPSPRSAERDAAPRAPLKWAKIMVEWSPRPAPEPQPRTDAHPDCPL
jgi:hypothetical protein